MTSKKSELDVLAEISAKLDEVIALMTIAGKEEDVQITILRNLKYDWKYIGRLLNLKPATVQKRFSRRKT